MLSASSASISMEVHSRVEARITCVSEGRYWRKSCLKLFSVRIQEPDSFFVEDGKAFCLLIPPMQVETLLLGI